MAEGCTLSRRPKVGSSTGVRTRVGGVFCLLLGVGVATGGTVAAASDQGRIRSEFQKICRTFQESDEPYYGRRPAQELVRLIESEGETADRTQILGHRLAWELIKLARTEEAIQLLERLLEKPGLAEPARLRLLVYLVMAHLQKGEDENCVLRHSAASCLLPISKGAVHALPQDARRAGDLCLQILKLRPGEVRAMWLLNLSRMVSGDYPQGVPAAFRLPEQTFQAQGAFPRWWDLAPGLGVDVVDLAGGAIMDDFDGDGLLDLVTSSWDPCDSLKAFRNDGHGGFENVTAAWGLEPQLGGLNLIQADYDNDGRLDLLVLRGGWLENGRVRNSLLHNELGEGAGRFVDVSRQAGLAEPAYPTQTAAWADFDGDGDLDVYIGNEASRDGSPYPSQLFRNNGKGAFTDIASPAGVANLRLAKGVAWGDIDNDGDPDLYVSNKGPNRLYRNNGDGSFTDIAAEAGVTQPEGWSFATWFFDYNNDGRLDLFVIDYDLSSAEVKAYYFGEPVQAGHPRLYQNEGNSFVERADQLALNRPLLAMGANYGDLDNDGWLDIYLGTGDAGFESLIPNVMLRNERAKRFEDVTFSGGFGHLQKGHGIAFGDIDNDGDQDLLHQLGGFYPGDAYGNALFENPTSGANWVTLRLEGQQANRFGVGARIEVTVEEAGGPRSVHLLAGSGGSFGGSSLQQEIGLGQARRIVRIRVAWPGSGTVQTFAQVAINRIYRVVESEPELAAVDTPPVPLERSRPQNHSHRHPQR